MISFAYESALSKAVRALQSSGIHPDCQHNREGLLSKHPQSTPPEEGQCDFEPDTRAREPPKIEEVTAEEVRKAINCFPRVSSGGGSGLTSTHLSEPLSAPPTDEDLELAEALATLTKPSSVDKHLPA